MTCLSTGALIGGIYSRKNTLQELLLSLDGVISTNESNQGLEVIEFITGHLYLKISQTTATNVYKREQFFKSINIYIRYIFPNLSSNPRVEAWRMKRYIVFRKCIYFDVLL